MHTPTNDCERTEAGSWRGSTRHAKTWVRVARLTWYLACRTSRRTTPPQRAALWCASTTTGHLAASIACANLSVPAPLSLYPTIWWQRLVGSLNVSVSFAIEPYQKRGSLEEKKQMSREAIQRSACLESLLILAIAYAGIEHW